jgi:hypothetical protein
MGKRNRCGGLTERPKRRRASVSPWMDKSGFRFGEGTTIRTFLWLRITEAEG